MEYLQAAARRVEQQALDNPSLGIPVDPDIADYMGAFFGDEDLGDVIEGDVDEEI